MAAYGKCVAGSSGGALLQCGQGVQRVKRSGVDGGDLVVVERQEANRAQSDKAAVAHAADFVAPQHAVHTRKGIFTRSKEAYTRVAEICNV